MRSKPKAEPTKTVVESPFDEPQKVLTDPQLTHDEKKVVLETMEQDARQMAVASSEGMTGGEPTTLSDVLDARTALDRTPTDLAYETVLDDLRLRRGVDSPGPVRESTERTIAAIERVAEARRSPVVP